MTTTTDTKMQRAERPAEKLHALVMSKKDELAKALPQTAMNVDRFLRIVFTAITKTPKILDCTQASIYQCLLDLSSLGLEPDGRKAHLIPYGDKCTVIVDYKGLVELARRSGEIADIHADVVGKNDKFDYSFGSNGALAHKPNLEDRGNIIAAYSFVRLKDGSSSYEVMNAQEIEAIRKRSKAGNNGPWKTDWNEMAKKTVFRRHSKWLPLSTEFQEAMEKDFDLPLDIPVPGKPVVEEPKAIDITAASATKQSPDDPITDDQRKYLDNLAHRAGFDVLSPEYMDFLVDQGCEGAVVTLGKFSAVQLALAEKATEAAKK